MGLQVSATDENIFDDIICELLFVIQIIFYNKNDVIRVFQIFCKYTFLTQIAYNIINGCRYQYHHQFNNAL